MADPRIAHIAALTAEIERLKQEIAENDEITELQRKAYHRAAKKWQEATGKELVWPDLTDLCVWLIERLEKAEFVLKDSMSALGQLSATQRGDGAWCLPGLDADGDLDFYPIPEWIERYVPTNVRREMDAIRGAALPEDRTSVIGDDELAGDVITRLRAALRPFAAYGKRFDGADNPSGIVLTGNEQYPRITVGDFRRAAEAEGE